jgi:Cu(I)/Ag(I) efflux system membrane protein CusA/SilA
VLICTYIEQRFKAGQITDKEQIRERIIQASQRRIRPALMTTATTILALIPVLTSTGRGSDIMVPMAIPSFGGMTIQILTVLVVPVLYSLVKESGLKRKVA